MATRPRYQEKLTKLIQELADQQIEYNDRVRIGSLLTDPVLKTVPGPDSIEPLEEGEEEKDHPGSIQQWFCDVKINNKGDVVQDAIVPTQARANVGQVGSPVTCWKEPSTGAWMVLGRADRVTATQSYISYSLQDLKLEFVKGLQPDPNIAGQWISPFYNYTQASSHIVTQARFNRGNRAGGTVVVGTVVQPVTLGPFILGVDPFGAYNIVTTYPSGNTVTTRRNP
jgi:hypothetical protein